MTDEEFKNLIPRKSKVKIIDTQEVLIVKGFVYIDDENPGYCVLLENDKYYSPEFLELIEF